MWGDTVVATTSRAAWTAKLISYTRLKLEKTLSMCRGPPCRNSWNHMPTLTAENMFHKATAIQKLNPVLIISYMVTPAAKS